MADRSDSFNTTIAYFSGVMQYAEKLGQRPRGSNPAKGIPRYKKELPPRFLEPKEYRRLFERLAECDDQRRASAI